MTTLTKDLIGQACLRARKSALLFATLVCFILQTAPLHATITVLAYWRLGENDPGAAPGVTVTNSIDSAGTNNLMFTGTAHYTNDVAATAAGATGSSLSVNFTDSAYATNGIVSTNVDNFGIECWVKPTALGGAEVIAYNGSTGGLGDGGWGIITSGNNYYGLFGGLTTLGGAAATANAWTHLALVRASGVATLYVNGVAAGTTTSGMPGVPAAGGFALAAPPQSPTSQFFTGLIDEVRVFTFAAGAFSTDDLLLNQNTSFSLTVTNLLEGPGVGIDSVRVLANRPSAPWTASANAAWLHVVDASGLGSAPARFTLDANSGSTRTGTVTVAGQTVTVTQAGSTYVAAVNALTNLISSGLNQPFGLAFDGTGNLYIGGSKDNTIKEWIAATATLTNLVSSGLNVPTDVAVDGAGNVYFSDTFNSLIKEWIAASNTVVTLVSSGIAYPYGLALDSSNNLYFADGGLNVIKVRSAASGTVSTVVSSGLNTPIGLALDPAGDIFIADENVPAIQVRSAATGLVTNLVSSGLLGPTSVVPDDAGNVYFTDYANNTLQKWNAANQTVSTLGSSPALFQPAGVALDAAGNVFVANLQSNAVEGLFRAFVDGATRYESSSGEFDSLLPVIPATIDLSGAFSPTSDQPWLTLYAEPDDVVGFFVTPNLSTVSNRTAHITLLGQQITVIQSAAIVPSSINLTEGPAAGADSVTVFGPAAISWGVSTDVAWLHPTNGAGNGVLNFAVDINSGPTRSGTITIGDDATITVTQAGTNYVAASEMIMDYDITPAAYGLAVDNAGDVFFSNNLLGYYGSDDFDEIDVWVAASQTITNVLVGYPGPEGVALDGFGNVYFTTSDGYLYEWYQNDGYVQPLINSLPSPTGVAVNGSGDVVFIATVYGLWRWDGTFGTNSLLPSPYLVNAYGVAADLLGNAYVSETNSALIKELYPAAFSQANLTNAYLTNGMINLVSTGTNQPLGVAADDGGNLYFVTSHNDIEEWNAAEQTVEDLLPGKSDPAVSARAIAVDGARNVYFSDVATNYNPSLYKLPHAFVPAQVYVPAIGGTTSLPPVLPTTVDQTGNFEPYTDVNWLLINGVTNGVISYYFTSNTNATPRVGTLTVLGQTVQVTQAAGPVVITPPVLTNVQVFNGGSVGLSSQGWIQFSFTNAPGLYFSVWWSTNAALPLSEWNFNEYVPDIPFGSGQYQFTQGLYYPQMFFIVGYPIDVFPFL